jgi:alpha-D-ribose 1-methylphosphonate 5-triphosphate synthase subunit PhnG
MLAELFSQFDPVHMIPAAETGVVVVRQFVGCGSTLMFIGQNVVSQC